LLAILLRTGTRSESVINLGSRLLAQFGGLAGIARASFADLCEVRGLGLAKAAQIKAALELGKRLMVASPEERPQVKSPADVANLLMMEMGFLEQEHLRVVLLDTKNHVLGMPTIYVGSLNTSVMRVGELFREAVRSNCAAVIVVHNHPSGDPTPSPEDVSITRQIVEAGKLLDVEVLDHLIIGQQRYVSLKERGLGFP
jgi:DNA repair protein RadC